MEKGFRTFQCHGCPAKLKFTVSDKDYGTTKIVRCPKCSARARIKIPSPPRETNPTQSRQQPQSPFDIFSRDLTEDIFKDILKGPRKK